MKVYPETAGLRWCYDVNNVRRNKLTVIFVCSQQQQDSPGRRACHPARAKCNLPRQWTAGANEGHDANIFLLPVLLLHPLLPTVTVIKSDSVVLSRLLGRETRTKPQRSNHNLSLSYIFINRLDIPSNTSNILSNKAL